MAWNCLNSHWHGSLVKLVWCTTSFQLSLTILYFTFHTIYQYIFIEIFNIKPDSRWLKQDYTVVIVICSNTIFDLLLYTNYSLFSLQNFIFKVIDDNSHNILIIILISWSYFRWCYASIYSHVPQSRTL